MRMGERPSPAVELKWLNESVDKGDLDAFLPRTHFRRRREEPDVADFLTHFRHVSSIGRRKSLLTASETAVLKAAEITNDDKLSRSDTSPL